MNIWPRAGHPCAVRRNSLTTWKASDNYQKGWETLSLFLPVTCFQMVPYSKGRVSLTSLPENAEVV
jgi:hypothetical protein